MELKGDVDVIVISAYWRKVIYKLRTSKINVVMGNSMKGKVRLREVH